MLGMASLATLAGLLMGCQPVLKEGSGFNIVRWTLEAAVECKSRGVGREEDPGRGRRKAGRTGCQHGGKRKKVGGRESTAALEQGAATGQKGVLLDISTDRRTPCAETLVGAASTSTSSPAGSKYEEEATQSGSSVDGARRWDMQEGGSSRENGGFVGGEESYEAQRDRQVAKVHKRFQLLLQQKSAM